MKTRFIGILLVAAFFILSFPSGAAASHSFAHIIETLQNALIEVHRMISPPAAPSDKFRMGDRIIVQSVHNARSDPLFSSWIVVGGAPVGARGTVIGSSRTISGTTWWNVIYDTGTFGWSREINLAKDSASAPSSPPVIKGNVPPEWHVSISGFSYSDTLVLENYVKTAFLTFGDRYRGVVKRMSILRDNDFQKIVADDAWLIPEEKPFVGAYADREGNIFVNGNKLLQGLNAVNPDRYNANDGSEDVIIHEIAHVVLDRCSCINQWIQINVEDFLKGVVSQFAKDKWAIAQEVFAETVVGYQNSGGDPTKIFSDSDNLNALRRKFNFLETQNIVSKAPTPIPTPTPTPTPAPAFGLRYFGYAEVDCGTNYIDEVASFTNLAHLCITLPSDTIVSRLDRFAARGVKAVINLDSIFFMSTVDRGCTPDPFQDRSCVLTTLRADYRTRWDTFVQTNQLKLQEAKIGAFWVKDEPAWNNLSVSSLAAAANIVKTDFPSVPTLAIEGWPAMDRFQMPSSIDWIGFDFYGVRNPATNAQYQRYFSILKSRRQAHQKLFIVMDGAWRASLQGSTGIFPWPGVGGLSQNDMAEVAQNYYTLAKSDLNVVGIGVLLWPSGIVTPDQIGSRDLPAAVRDQHRQIGKSITGKN